MKKRALHIVGALVSAACLYYSLRHIYQTGGFELLRNSPGALAAAIGLALVAWLAWLRRTPSAGCLLRLTWNIVWTTSD